MFELEIEGFSGPLDLLCHMIDQDEIEAARISVAEVVAIYTSYLAKSGELPISSIAEFIAQAAHLVRQKTVSILPRYDEPDLSVEEDFIVDPETDVVGLVERYRPYRTAAALLAALKEKADKRRFRREEDRDPFFDLGDLYSLSIQWLDLLDRRRRLSAEVSGEDYSWQEDGLPAEIPDEAQVEKRMERLMERLGAVRTLSLRSVLKEEPGRSSLVVTLLALLELSRRNLVSLFQKELFADVTITAREGE